MTTRFKAETKRRLEARPARAVDPKGYIGTFNSYGFTLRPLHTRDETAEVYVTFDQIYRWALEHRGLRGRRVPLAPRRRFNDESG